MALGNVNAYHQPKQHKNENGVLLKVNFCYELKDGRIGICKYLGATGFAKSKKTMWVGLELSEPPPFFRPSNVHHRLSLSPTWPTSSTTPITNTKHRLAKGHKGKHNGSVEGESYFKCEVKGQGVFVNANRVVKKIANLKGHTGVCSPPLHPLPLPFPLPSPCHFSLRTQNTHQQTKTQNNTEKSRL